MVHIEKDQNKFYMVFNNIKNTLKMKKRVRSNYTQLCFTITMRDLLSIVPEWKQLNLYDFK